MSGRSRSLATTVFFETNLLGVNEVPYCSIVNFQPALGEFGHEPAQSEPAFPDPSHQEGVVFSGNGLRLVPTHLARRYATSLPENGGPI